MRQDQAEEGNLLALPSDLDHRLAEVDLGMARRVMQRNEGLARRLAAGPDMVLDDRVAAGKAVLVPKPLEDPMRRVLLLAQNLRIGVRLQDRIEPSKPATTTGGRTRLRHRTRIARFEPDIPVFRYSERLPKT